MKDIARDVVLPGDEAYDQLRRTVAHTGRPVAIVRCHDTGDVQRAIASARDRGLPLSIRGGGHSSAGFSTNDGGIVVDLSPLNGVEVVGGPRDLVRLGTGARWGDVARALAAHGLTISSGDTKEVGVGGSLVGGGIGWMVRLHGLTIDRLLAAEVVTADGRVLRASADENPDLFWAIRGGGGNFGVLTAVELAAGREPEVTFGRITYPITEAVGVLTAWRDAMREAGDALTSTAILMPAMGDQPPSLMIVACFAGADPNRAGKALEPLLRLGTLDTNGLRPMSYPDILDDAHQVPPGMVPSVRNRFATAFSDELIAAIADGAGTPNMGIEIRGLGGAMARVPADATAFAHRDAEVMLNTVQPGGDPEAFEAFWRKVLPMTAGAYVNFLSAVDDSDTEAAYPSATRARLTEIKRAYDPENLFRRNVNLAP